MENITQIWKKIQSPEFNPATDMNLVETVKQVALTSQEPAKVSFGTSGWRGEIGSEFTLRNLQVVGAAIVRLYKEATPELFAALGVKDFAELQKRGVVVGHDNRLLGHEFCEAVADQFAKAGVKVYYGGEMPTPEFSAAIEMLGAACSINMTPSHNPSHYNGIKFNPADGGPAGPEITNVITKLSNEMMATWKFEPVSKVDWEIIDSLKIYKEFLVKQGTIKFDRIKEFMSSGCSSRQSGMPHHAPQRRRFFVRRYRSGTVQQEPRKGPQGPRRKQVLVPSRCNL